MDNENQENENEVLTFRSDNRTRTRPTVILIGVFCIFGLGVSRTNNIGLQLICILVVVGAVYLYQKYRVVSIEVHDDYIRIVPSRKDITIPYTEIESVRISGFVAPSHIRIDCKNIDQVYLVYSAPTLFGMNELWKRHQELAHRLQAQNVKLKLGPLINDLLTKKVD